MVLSNEDIKEEILKGGIKIYIDHKMMGVKELSASIQPASLDLHLGNSFALLSYPRFNERGNRVPVELMAKEEYQIYKSKEFVLKPNRFCLATTQECVWVPDYLVGRLEGRSSVGRKGLFIHNAGFIDPGFSGDITLELFNCTGRPVVLKEGIRICQIVFEYLNTTANPAYNGKYQNQEGVTPSRLHMDLS